MWCDVCRNKGKKNSMADGIKINQRQRDEQKGDLNQEYKSLGKMDKCHHSLLYGDNLAKRVKSINDTNGVAQSLTAGSSGTHRGGQLGWNTGHNQTNFVTQSFCGSFLDQDFRSSSNGKSY